MTRIVAISDTHGFHDGIKNLPHGDILIHAGDSTIYGELSEMHKVLSWFSKLDFEKIIFINGNHEVVVSNLGNLTRLLVKERCGDNVVYLEDQELVYRGLKFYGSPKSVEYGYWAYMYKESDGERIWGSVPDDIDVLICHGPAYGMLDQNKFTTNCGSKSLLNRIEQIKPSVFISGHIHESYGYIRPANPKYNKTLFVNASVCNARYDPVNKPIIIDVDDLTKVATVVDK